MLARMLAAVFSEKCMSACIYYGGQNGTSNNCIGGRSGARGGLEGAIAPRRSMLAPRRKVKSDFFGDFWHL